MDTLQSRFKQVLAAQTPARGRFVELEQLSESKIPSASWASVWYGRQRPTAEMIELVCQTWPQYALWVVAGITQPESGHEAPGLPGFDTARQKQYGEHLYSKKLLQLRVDLLKKASAIMSGTGCTEAVARDAVLHEAKEYPLWDSLAEAERKAEKKPKDHVAIAKSIN